jgi:hypothetical protein
LEEVRKNQSTIKKELDSLEKEMRALRQRAELVDLYHHWMEEFDNLKMEYVFMKAKLMIYQNMNKRSQTE